MYLYYITVSPSVCKYVCVCLLSNSSKTVGRIWFIFRGMIDMTPAVDLIYIA